MVVTAHLVLVLLPFTSQGLSSRFFYAGLTMTAVNILTLDSPPSFGNHTPGTPQPTSPAMCRTFLLRHRGNSPFLQLHSCYTTISPIIQIFLGKNHTSLQYVSKGLTLMSHLTEALWQPQVKEAMLPTPQDLNIPSLSQILLIKCCFFKTPLPLKEKGSRIMKLAPNHLFGNLNLCLDPNFVISYLLCLGTSVLTSHCSGL